MRSRGTEGQGKRERDLIEAGLSEPAGWRAGYGDFGDGDWSEARFRVPPVRLGTRSERPSSRMG